ncbi:hypothetical protein BB561_000511 [Smittium simulii]|uniref:Uncharacterized protein n=1 Tax=Smittium simulii TaxID=133385 RepID=A0A2T9YYY0_9FUNG|nr:hypothetical protein BB561_000511 [Smittium simulii]
MINSTEVKKKKLRIPLKHIVVSKKKSEKVLKTLTATIFKSILACQKTRREHWNSNLLEATSPKPSQKKLERFGPESKLRCTALYSSPSAHSPENYATETEKKILPLNGITWTS